MLELFHKYINQCFEIKFLHFILNNFSIKSFSFKKKDWVELTLIPKELSELLADLSKNANVLRSGFLCGWIHKNRFIPAPHLFNLSRGCGFSHGCGVVVKSQGVKAFLYGNDILLSSFDHFIPPIKKGEYVAVLDSSDMYVVGVGVLLIAENEVEQLIREGKMLTVIIKNVFDLGIHIRNERFFIY
jgi:ribosome biogenesis protein Nip4